MRTPVKITTAEANLLKSAQKKKQKTTANGATIGTSPEQATQEIYKVLGAKYNMAPETIQHYLKDESDDTPYNYITGDLFAPGAIAHTDGATGQPDHIPMPELPMPGFNEAPFLVPEPDIPHGPGNPAEESHDSFEYMDGESGPLLPFTITPEEKPWIVKFDQMEMEVAAILETCKKMVVKDPTTRDQAATTSTGASKLAKKIIEKAKQLAEPMDLQVKVIKGIGKKLAEPLEAGVVELKKKITDFNLEAEKTRLEQIRIQQEEQKKAQEEQQKEAARVSKLRGELQAFTDKIDSQVAALETIAALDAFKSSIAGWNPKKEYWLEFYDQLMTERTRTLNQAESRRPLILALEKQKADAAAAANKSAAENAAAQKSAREAADKLAAMQLKEQQQAEEAKRLKAQMEQSCKLSIQETLNTLGWTKTNMAQELELITSLYGSFTNAFNDLEKMTAGSSTRLIEINKLKELEAGKAKNMRTVWKARVTDPNLIPREYLQVDLVKINGTISTFKEEIEAGTFIIAGVEFYSESTTVNSRS